jgi:hydrogenase/urease accessory protein HupE
VAPVIVLLLSTAQPAFAHVQKGEATGFRTGFLHPISGLNHVLAMLAVGLWGAQLGAPAIWLLPVVFPMIMAMGGMLGLLGVPFPGIEYGIAASAILLGIDQVMDMGRTAVNVMGNCIATVVVARWEGVLDDNKVRAFAVADQAA